MQIHELNPPCGIVHSESRGGREIYLPLECAEVHADVVDVSALVTISQKFWQHSPSGLMEAKYVFPVPARAAICGFEMIAEDGTVITALVKEKEEAYIDFKEALHQGYMAGLVEHVTDDIFSVSLGALPGQQIITTQITYVLDLMDDDASDQVRLQLPMYIGMRYGFTPEGMIGARVIPPNRIHISVDVRMQGAVKEISSPTHPTVVISPNEPERISQTAQYTSKDFLTQDFVLIVTAEGLDAPRCFAQRAPNGTIAMQLSIVPKFNLPPVPQQEYIFLVDRSGSMSGQRIDSAKRALVMLLRALPSQGTWFNIFSFGSSWTSLWPESVPYDERSMSQATKLVDGMDGDYGGTELGNALVKAFQTRKTDIPSAVFVLTDGELFNIDQTIVPVKEAVKQAATNAPVRVFTLGIGETTSSALCEGIARAGNGICLMATTAETIVGKCSRLVRASRTYVLKNVSVDWGVRTDIAKAYRSGDINLKGVRQAPAEISSIYPGNRFVVFALIEDTTFTPPKEIIIRAQRDGYGEVLQFSVPVREVGFPPEHHPQPLIQTLAARRAIMDLEDGSRTTLSQGIKSIIIRLGMQYQLASSYTSFIAVDRRTNLERTESEGGRSKPVFPIPFERSAYLPTSPPPAGGVGSFLGSVGSMLGMRTSPASPPPRTITMDANSGSSHFQWPSGSFFGLNLFGSRASKSAGPGNPGVSRSAASVQVDFLRAASYDDDEQQLEEAMDDGVNLLHVLDGLLPVDPLAQSMADRVLQLIRLQSFDGSFPPDKRLSELLGGTASFAESQTLGVSDKVWATVLAVAWLKEYMTDEPELLADLVEKAMDFIARTPGIDTEVLFARASVVLPPL